MKRRPAIALIVSVAVGLGALREFLFVNLNYQLDHVVHATERSYAHSLFQQWTAGMGGGSLSALKWGLSAGFILVMLGLTVLFARVLFHDHRYTRQIALGYLAVGLAALALQAGATWLPPLAVAAVKLVHLLQYPVILLFVWGASRLVRRDG